MLSVLFNIYLNASVLIYMKLLQAYLSSLEPLRIAIRQKIVFNDAKKQIKVALILLGCL